LIRLRDEDIAGITVRLHDTVNYLTPEQLLNMPGGILDLNNAAALVVAGAEPNNIEILEDVSGFLIAGLHNVI
jgi:hypothetical protein